MKIELNELMEQVKVALKDEFVAKIETTENGLTLEFLNGQKFNIRIEETK